MEANVHEATVRGFGQEWTTYSHEETDREELREILNEYFAIFPLTTRHLPTAEAADFGCGTGRWAQLTFGAGAPFVSNKASGEALDVARRNLCDRDNVTFLHHTQSTKPPWEKLPWTLRFH